MWCDVMRRAFGATLWPSPAPHPAERALEDGLLHFNRYQAGHQAGECVVDDGREGRLVRRQREVKKEQEVRKHTYLELHSCNVARTRYLELCHELLQVNDELLHPGIIRFVIIKLLLWGTTAVTATRWPLIYFCSLFWERYLFYVVWDGQEAADPGFDLRLYGCCV